MPTGTHEAAARRRIAGAINNSLHIVDGGYFEDSGATTLEEVYRSIQSLMNENLVPVILYIANGSDRGFQVGVLYKGLLETIVKDAPKRCIRVEVQGKVPDELRKRPSACRSSPAAGPNEVVIVADRPMRNTLRAGWFYTLLLDKDNKVIQVYEPDAIPLDEVATPFYTIFRARLARGSYAYKHLQRQVPFPPQGRFFHFQLRTGTAKLPLGWTLSEEAAREMNRQLKSLFQRCKQDGTLLDYFDSCWPNDVVMHEE